jgi:fatty-acyl-CoA synthase
MHTDAARPPLEFKTLPRLLLDAVERQGDGEALVFPAAQLADNRRTWRELLHNGVTLAKALIAHGIERGDHVGLFMPNSIDFIESLLGCSLLGAVPVPINVRYRTAELRYVIANARVKLLITSTLASDHVDLCALLRESFPEADKRGAPGLAAPELRSMVESTGSGVSGFVDGRAFRDAGTGDDEAILDNLDAIHIDEPALLIYTSGTTANPKGCVLSHRALVGNAIAMGRQRFYLNARDRFWDPLPMFHMASLLQFTAMTDAGGTFLSMVYLDIGLALEMLERERATVCYSTFPTITADLINHPDFKRRDLSRIRRLNGVAPPETLRTFQEAFPQAVQTSAYGLTEAGGVISHNDPSEPLESRLTTCGAPLQDIEVRILALDTGDDVTGRGSGEIQIRGYCLFDGYYDDPDATAAVMDGDWLRTGDLGSIDDNGRIRYEGRTKDMLKVGGENLSALELESFLATHPAVKLAQVVGEPHPRLQEVPVAFVELLPGAACSEQDLLDFCKGQISGFKVPRKVRFVTEWPMSATKIQKFRLRELLNEAAKP